MKSRGEELKIPQQEMQPASRPEAVVSVRPDLEKIEGGKKKGISQNEQHAYEKVEKIENEIQILNKSAKESSSENKSALDATRLEILNRQLPHAQQLRENLSILRKLEEQGNDTLKSMQIIIAPQEKRALTFPEIQDAWANNSEKSTYAPDVLEKLTDELDELALQYAQIEAQIEERKNMHINAQEQLYKLENSIQEVDAIKQEIVSDVTSRIKIKKQGGSLVAESDSAIFEKIGTYLEEYETAIDDEWQRIADELAKLEADILLLEQQAGVKSVGEFLKSLINKSTKQKTAKDKLAEARGKENELKTQLERMSLIQRALGFASGHVGATPAGLSNLDSRLDLTAGAGMIAPKPSENQSLTVARVALSHTSAMPASFEFGAEAVAREIMRKTKEQQARQKTEKSPSPATVTEIPPEEIYEEDKIPALPTAKEAASLPIQDVSRLDTDTRAQKITKKENETVQELKKQTTEQKAVHLLDYIMASVNRSSDPLEERSARFEEKASSYIDLIVLPEETRAVEAALQTHFLESVKDEDQKSAEVNLLRKRLEFAKQKLSEREKKTSETEDIEFNVEDLLNPDRESGISAPADVEISTKNTAPAAQFRVEHKPAQKPVSEQKLLTPEEESQLSALGSLMSELNNKRLKPIFTALNARKLSYENALKQAIAETDRAIHSLSKDERKKLSKMYSEMIEDLKESRASKGKNMSSATEKLLKEIAKRINPDWTEPKKPTGLWKKWLAGILSSVAIGGVAAEAGKQSERSGETRSASSTEEPKEDENKITVPTEKVVSSPSPITEKPIIAQPPQQKEAQVVRVEPKKESESVIPDQKEETGRTVSHVAPSKKPIEHTTPSPSDKKTESKPQPLTKEEYRRLVRAKGPEQLVDTSDIGKTKPKEPIEKEPPKTTSAKEKKSEGLDIKLPPSERQSFPTPSEKTPPAYDKKAEPVRKAPERKYTEESTPKKPAKKSSPTSETRVNTSDIRAVNEMSKAEAKLLEYNIAFRIIFGQPRLVKKEGYTGTDSRGEEKALRVLEAACKQVRDNPNTQSIDHKRAEKLIAAIQHARMEGLQD